MTSPDDRKELLALADTIEGRKHFYVGETRLVDLPLVTEAERQKIIAALRASAPLVSAGREVSPWLNAYADAHLQISALKKAAGKLVSMARTSGGVAGRDEGLCSACDVVEKLLTKQLASYADANAHSPGSRDEVDTWSAHARGLHEIVAALQSSGGEG